MDTVPPQLKCKALAQADVSFQSVCQTTLHATTMVESVTDNTSPMSDIVLCIRKKCTSDGFPNGQTSLTFRVVELGITEVELWAKDQAGNTASCQSLVAVQDNSGSCDPVYGGQVFFPKDSSDVKRVVADINRWNCQGDSSHRQLDLSEYEFGSLSIPGDYLTVTPTKSDDPLNGVSTYDLVLISKHILGLSKLSAAQLIAADANRDGKVTTYDIVLLHQLILGIIPELPGGVSWRFWPYDYPFPDPDNPFAPPFPERIEVPRSADPVLDRFVFFGVKIGDVNFSAALE